MKPRSTYSLADHVCGFLNNKGLGYNVEFSPYSNSVYIYISLNYKPYTIKIRVSDHVCGGTGVHYEYLTTDQQPPLLMEIAKELKNAKQHDTH